MHLLVLLVLANSSGADLPSHWWIVEASSGRDVGRPGTGWRLGSEFTIVDDAHVAARRTALACTSRGPETWHCERSVAGTLNTIDLFSRPEPRLGRELVVTLGRTGEPAYGQMTARAARPDENAWLEAFAAQAHLADVAACGRAKACYDLACPAFKDKDDPCIFAHHSMSHDATSCTALIPMLASTLTALERPVPPECAPPK